MKQALNLQQFAASLEAIVQRSANLTPVLRVGSVMAVSEVKRRFNDGRDSEGVPWKPIGFRARGGNKPLLDTGQLRASVVGTSDSRTITVGTNKVQAPLHQFGGVVRPKRSKFLAIPLTPAAARSGSPRRYRGNLRPRISRDGNSGVLLERDASGRDRAVYVLVKMVKVPARPFLGWSAGYLDQLRKMAGAWVLTGQMNPQGV